MHKGILLIWFVALFGGALWAEPVQVLQSSLPSGLGLGARLNSEGKGTEADQVIFSEDFESPDFRQRWDEIRDTQGRVLSRVVLGDDGEGMGHSLRVAARLGQNTGGGLTKWFSSARELYIRFYTRFDQQCDYVHHFVTLRANQSLKGAGRWSGFGGAGLRPDGTERFSTALEPWGNWGRWPAPGRWNFYTYWHEMEESRDGKYWGNSFRIEGQASIPKDRWICAEFMIRHNTPNESNGEQAFWIDGKLMGHWKGFNWRRSETLMANAITLESYVTNRWTKNPVNVVYFDNLVVRKSILVHGNRARKRTKSLWR